MTVVKAGNKDTFSGKVGNLVVVSRGETTYLRSMPTHSMELWTPKQARPEIVFSRPVRGFINGRPTNPTTSD